MKRDTEKARAFQQRGRGKLSRKRKPRPEEGPLSREEWEAAVYRLDEGRCIVTARRVLYPRPENFHHVVPKQRLRRDGRFDLVWHPDNGVLVEGLVHARHENAFERIPRERLPSRCIDFAREHGYESVIESATYPTTEEVTSGRRRRS